MSSLICQNTSHEEIKNNYGIEKTVTVLNTNCKRGLTAVNGALKITFSGSG